MLWIVIENAIKMFIVTIWSTVVYCSIFITEEKAIKCESEDFLVELSIIMVAWMDRLIEK